MELIHVIDNSVIFLISAKTIGLLLIANSARIVSIIDID